MNGYGRLAAATANLSPVAEGDKRLQRRRSFATGDLGQQPPQRREQKLTSVSQNPRAHPRAECPSIRGDTSLRLWQVNNWPAGRQGDESWNQEHSYKICDDVPHSQFQYVLELWFKKQEILKTLKVWLKWVSSIQKWALGCQVAKGAWYWFFSAITDKRLLPGSHGPYWYHEQ